MINADNNGSAAMYDNSTWQQRRVAAGAVDSGDGQWHQQLTGVAAVGGGSWQWWQSTVVAVNGGGINMDR